MPLEATLRHQCANWYHHGKTYSSMVHICFEVLHAFSSIFTIAERMLVINWKNSWKLILTFFWRSSLMTKACAIVMTWKQSSNQVTGSIQRHHNPKKRVKWSPMSRRCWFVSLMWKEFSTKNLFLLVKLLTRLFTWKSWSVCETRWDENALTCGKVVGGGWWLHHDNVPAHTALNVRQFLTQNGMTPPSLLPRSHPLQLFLFPQMKKVLKRKRFQMQKRLRRKQWSH